MAKKTNDDGSRKPNRLDESIDFDFDAAFTPEERTLFQRFPILPIGVILACALGLFLGLLGVTHLRAEVARNATHYERLADRLSALHMRAANIAPGEASEWYEQWRQAGASIDYRPIGVKRSSHLHALAEEGSVSFGLAIVGHLRHGRHLSPDDVVDLAVILHGYRIGEMPGSDAVRADEIEDLIAGALRVGGREVVRLGRAEAAVEELVHARRLSDRLADISSGEVAQNFASVSVRLVNRVRIMRGEIESRIGAHMEGRDVGHIGGSLQQRQALVTSIQEVVEGGATAIVDVGLDPEDDRALMVTGEASATTIGRAFMETPVMRERLLAFGFTRLTLRGSDRTREVDVTSAEVVREDFHEGSEAPSVRPEDLGVDFGDLLP